MGKVIVVLILLWGRWLFCAARGRRWKDVLSGEICLRETISSIMLEINLKQ